jgi:hypothetical protein
MFGITPDNLDIQTVRDDTRDVNPHVRDPQGIVLLKGQLDSQTPIYLQYAQSRTVLGRRSITVIDGRELEQNMGNLWAAATACSWRELVTATYALRCNADLRATEEEIATLLNYQLINRSVTPNNTGLAHALLELRETRNRTQGLRVIPASVVASFGDAGANLAPPADAKHIED